MPDMGDSEPSLGEISRGVSDIKAELRLMRGEFVRGDNFLAHRATDDLRFRSIEENLKGIHDDRASTRRLAYGALFAAVFTIIAQILLIGLTHL